MTAKPCMICNKMLDGWVYDFRTHMSHINEIQEHIVGFQCVTCGAVVCPYIHNKVMKASAFSGLHKVTCPKCGGPFGPASVITSREMSRLTAIDEPSTNLQPWAEIFLDKRNGERLLAADQLSDDMGLNNFRMVLTDRRLIYLPSGSLTVNQSRIQDYYYKIIPLRRITSVKINKTLTGGASLVIDTVSGESHKYVSKAGFEKFGKRIQEAIPNAPPALVFPKDETVYYAGDNLGFLWTSNLPSEEPGAEIHLLRFYYSLQISLAVTNNRMLFYRITHGIGDQLGEPTLQFISIPWRSIRRISTDTSLLSKGVNLVLDQPVWAWMTRSLTVYPYDEITCTEYRHPCVTCHEAIIGGVGAPRVDAKGMTNDKTQTGWHCPTCNTSYHNHKKCLPTKATIAFSSTEKCPVCKNPMLTIDRSYAQVTLKGQTLAEAPYLVGQQPATPPWGVSGQEWNLPVTANIKGWQEQVFPAVQRAYPHIIVEGKGR